MIKGKWRIDLGGKIKGAKSVALGSAVTKRGQDNSLQMCERCKYQTGGGEAAGGAGGAGRGAGQPPGGLETLGRLPHTEGPSPVEVRGEGNGVSGNPRFRAGIPFLGRGFAGLVLPSKSHSRAAGHLRSRVQIPRESLGAPGLSRRSPARQAAWVPQPSPRAPPRRPASRPLAPPWPGGRRAAAAPSAVEASGAAVCGGHFAEEPGAEGMQMRQTRGGERRRREGGRWGAVMDACPAGGRRGRRGRQAQGAAFRCGWARPGRLGACAGLGGDGARSGANPPARRHHHHLLGLGACTPARQWACAPLCKQNS